MLQLLLCSPGSSGVVDAIDTADDVTTLLVALEVELVESIVETVVGELATSCIEISD